MHLLICISLMLSFVKSYIVIPFNISDRKDNYKQDIPLHSFDTLIYTKHYDCKKFGLSLSTYVTWECINKYSFQNNDNSIYFYTSHGVVEGNVNSSVLNYKNVKLPLNIFQVTQSNDACFWFRESYGLDGEIGLGVSDLKEKKLNNFSFIEQLSEHELFDKEQKFTLVFNNKTHQPNKGVLLFGNNKQLILNLSPKIKFETEYNYIKLSISFIETIYFQSTNQKYSNNILLQKRLTFTYENKITFIPDNYYESFMNEFLEHLTIKHNNNKTKSFNYFCKVQKIHVFSKYISCKKDILNYFDLPFVSFVFSNQKEIVISLNEMFYDNNDSLIFGIGFNSDSNSIILGMNFFNKFISEYNVKNRSLTLYELSNNNIDKIFRNNNNTSKLYVVCYYCIILLMLSSLFLLIFINVNVSTKKSSMNINLVKYECNYYN